VHERHHRLGQLLDSIAQRLVIGREQGSLLLECPADLGNSHEFDGDLLAFGRHELCCFLFCRCRDRGRLLIGLLDGLLGSVGPGEKFLDHRLRLGGHTCRLVATRFGFSTDLLDDLVGLTACIGDGPVDRLGGHREETGGRGHRILTLQRADLGLEPSDLELEFALTFCRGSVRFVMVRHGVIL
jgi:hypothetical protein